MERRNDQEQGPSDESLVKAYLEGSDEAFEELVRRYERTVFNLAWRVVGNRSDAVDVAQETFILLMRKVHTFRGEASFSTWLYRVSLNAARDYLRKNKRHLTLSSAPSEDMPKPEELLEAEGACEPENAFSVLELQERVQTAINALPQKFKEVVYLHDIKGFNYDVTSRILKIPEGTVKSRLNRARAKLARELGETGNL